MASTSVSTVALSFEQDLRALSSVIRYAAHFEQKYVVFSNLALANVLSLALRGVLPSSDFEKLILRLFPNLTKEEFIDHLSKITYNLTSLVSDVKMVTALFLSEDADLKIKDNYMKELVKNHSFLEKLPFQSNPAESIDCVNGFVSLATNYQITDFWSPKKNLSDLKAAIFFVMHFQGEWMRPFSPSYTKTASFKNSKFRSEVEMMNNRHFFMYGENEKFQFLMLRYESPFVMTIELPKDEDFDIEKNFLEPDVDYGNISMNLCEVDFYLPKFKQSSKLDLLQGLKQFGLGPVFEEGLTEVLEEHPLRINEVTSEFSIEVDETGTKASAAVSLEGGETCGPPGPPPPKPILFKCDHPFFWHLVDLRNKITLIDGFFE